MEIRVNRCLRIIVGFTLGVILTLQSNNIIRTVLATAKDASTVVSSKAQINEGPRLPLGRGSHAGGIIDGRIVIVGGTSWNLDRTRKSFLNDSVIFEGKCVAAGAND